MRHAPLSPALKMKAVKTTATLGLALAALSPVWAQDATPPAPPATTGAGPGPATQPPPPPGTAVPGPTQAPAAPAPPGTVAAPGAPAPEAPAAPPPNYKIQYTGLIDGYLQYQFNNPHGTLLDNGAASGAYNARIKTPTLQLAEINVFNNPKPGGFAFKTTLIAGDAADQNAVNFNYATGSSNGSSGEAQFKNIQQLYGTYAFAGSGGGIDVGKFYTPFGFEVTEANGDYNYTRSLAYNLVPFYHAGARIYSPSLKGLVATGYVVNALFNSQTEGVHSENGKRGFIGQLNYTDPKGKYVAIVTGGSNKDRLSGTTTDSKDTCVDVDLTYNINANQIVAGEYVYTQLKPDGGAKTTDNGYAAYYRQQVTPKVAGALRFSGFNSKTDGAGSLKPNEVTLTYEYKATAAFTTRLEYRHDSSNVQDYLGKNDIVGAMATPTKKNEDLILVAGLFTF